MRELSDVELIARDGVWIASVRGEIDLSNADSTLATLAGVVDEDSDGLIVDLSGLDYLDSAGVRLLFRLGRAVSESGGSLRAVVPKDARIRRVLELAQVERALALDETTDAAIAGLRGRAHELP
jgi:anti-anti-sigma factor